MGSCLKDYVFQKFPVDVITAVIKNRGAFELHNNQLCEGGNFNKFLHRIDFEYKHGRRYNFIRPYFYINDLLDRFVISTVPGSDYLIHYASMLSFVLNYFGYRTQIIVKRYKVQESKIALITGLNNNFVKSDNIVVIGSVDRIFDYFMTNVNCIFLDSFDNKYYTSNKFKIGNSIVNLIGVKYSFWGNISSKLVYRFCSLGAKEIVYISKLGALTNIDDIYNKVFIPSETFFMRGKEIVYSNENINKEFLSMYNNISTGPHLSVSTILEENTMQKYIAQKLKINSIDNEISQIANTKDNFNKLNSTNIGYTSLHFATDYLKSRNELDMQVELNLSNNRCGLAKSRKEIVTKKIVSLLLEYLLMKG